MRLLMSFAGERQVNGKAMRVLPLTRDSDPSQVGGEDQHTLARGQR